MAKRVHRNLKLARVAANLVCFRTSNSAVRRDRLKSAIAKQFGELHGLPQKVGQMLSLLDPGGIGSSFVELTEGLPTMGSEESFAELAYQLDKPLSTMFGWIDPCGISASIGQVHQARLLDGTKVAVKVQYPEVQDAIDNDLSALGMLASPLGNLKRDFDFESYKREVGTMLRQELDYQEEARSMERFRLHSKEIHGLEVPKVIPELCRGNVLVMEWIDGERFSEIESWNQIQKDQIAETLLRVFWHGLLEWGIIHGDPHQGNYRFRVKEGRAWVGLLDFGCMKLIPEEMRLQFCRLVWDRVVQDPDVPTALEWFEAVGFKRKSLIPMADRLPGVLRVLSEPFRMGASFRIAEWNPGSRLATLLQEHRIAFRASGPSELLYILRAFQGLIHYLTRLGVELSWKECLPRREFCLREEVTLIDQSLPFKASEIVPPPKSELLKIEVYRSGCRTVALSFGAEAAFNLRTIVPDDIQGRLAHQGIDLVSIGMRSKETQFEPGELFSWNNGEQKVRVWLE